MTRDGELGFDRIIVHTAGGARAHSLSEFQAIPLATRVAALLEKRVEFYLGGTRVDTDQALSALRRRALRAR